jgi:putative hydrolase of the HAD superfamily
MKNRPDVDFIIFDLGNVLIDIDYPHAMDLMKSALPANLHNRVDHCYTANFHKAYEKGQISSAEFRQEFRNYFQTNWSDAKVDYYWNSLLGTIPAYSHEMGLAKPNQDIYQQLLLELGTTANRVLFFDDLKANVHGASSVGIQAIQVVGPETLLNFFGDV